MEDKRKLLVKEFYEKLVYGKTISKIELNKAIDISIKKAYLTICRILSKDNSDLTKDAIYDVILKDELKILLTNNAYNFDKWHKEVCTTLVNKCNDVFKNFNYGVAQKIVNMSIKYLYCIISDEDFNHKDLVKFNNFENCHATLDSKIISNIVENNKSLKKLRLSEINDYDTYMKYQNALKIYCKKNGKDYPFFYEFKIWKKITKE